MSPDADREIARLPDRVAAEIGPVLLDLEEDPRPLDSVELRGHAGYYRIRLDGYRLIYRISESRRRVRVLRVRARASAYIGFESP